MAVSEYALYIYYSIMHAGNCSDGAIRLMNGRDQYEGRVEVCFSGLWGTVCDNHWDTTEAEVVCTQLGLLDSKRKSVVVITAKREKIVHFFSHKCHALVDVLLGTVC